MADGIGRLEQREWSRFIWAWSAAASLVTWLYSAGNLNMAGETDVRVDSSSAPTINLPATWLAADEIARYLQELNRFSTPEQAANDQKGSYLAIELGKAVSKADRRWPREDKPHAMRLMRCAGCSELTLMYRPPRFPGDAIVVDCPKCGYSMPEDLFSVNALLIEAEIAGADVAVDATEVALAA
ncbi:hypothetical protein ACFWHR_07790 [Leucobacter sp. NPDC058333]|uniref:hypothetical protein n=1 Tax=Leucobacter sp. NPDC058333 TaxID=3346450 RepID=UPI003665FBDF